MAFSSTQPRPFAPLGSSNSPTLNTNQAPAALKSSLGNGAGPWGSKTASIWGSGNVPNTLASQTTSSDRVQTLKSLQIDTTSETTAKKGSGSLLASSESDSWRPNLPRDDARPSLPAKSLRSPSTVEMPRNFPNGNTTLSPTGTRPPIINLTNPAFPHARSTLGASHPWSNFGVDAPNVYPKNKERQYPSAYTPADSVIEHASATTSPVTERRPQWSSHYSNPTSVSASRDASRAPSVFRADRQYPLPSAEHSISHTSHYNNSLSPSSRNGSFSSAGNLTDQLNASFTNLGVRQSERPSSSRSLPSGTRIVPVDHGNGAYFDSVQDVEHYLPIQHALTAHNDVCQYGIPHQQQQQQQHQQQNHAAGFPFSVHDLQTIDSRPGHYISPANAQNGHPQNHRQQISWQDIDTANTLMSRRSNAPHDQQLLLDPRTAAQIMAMKNSFNVQNTFGNAMPMSMNNLRPFLGYYPTGLGSVPTALPAAPEVEQGLQSAKLFDFKMAGKNTRRYELKDIYEHIAEFAGDQHGSRFIQTKLETANSDEKERVFREIEPNAIPLMTDVFGNYVIQKFLDHGHQEHKKILANKMRGQVLNLSTQMYGCRVVQKALEHVLLDQQAALVNELKHHVLKCVKDQNGNHVIQKVIERCSTDSISFVYEAFIGQVHSLSLHPYGCRVIQRCLERTEWYPAKPIILAELHESVPKGMIGDSYGNYVVQHIVQNGPEPDRQHVLGIVLSDVEGYSKHKFASNVVEKCIEYSDDQWRRQVVEIFTKNDNRRPDSESVLVGLIKDQYGNYVIQRLLDRLLAQDYIYFHHQLQPAMTHAKRTGSGKQVVSIEKKMQRFDFVPSHHEYQQSATAQPMSPGQHTPFNTISSQLNTVDALGMQNVVLAQNTGDAVEGATSMSRQGSELATDYSSQR